MRASSLFLVLLVACPAIATAEDAAADQAGQVSYYRDVRPVLQANCQGCHQPAKRGGDYLMTDHKSLMTAGESGSTSVVAGDPAASYLIDLITPVDGKAKMPKGKTPLSETDRKTILNWILQGAQDDTPESAKVTFDAAHPPTYVRAPVLTCVAFSPDGQLIAVSGYHEVLLQKADGSGVAGRLVGMSERIESVAFSPDGKRLAVAGGSPGRLGELQMWDVAERKLLYSVPVSYDNVYGASWSPDGKLVAIGCGDNSVRAFDAENGQQSFFNGAHEDWALDTVFSKDGSHLVSVSRDMAVKLYEVKTQRFVDNVTSITPGALKGGINAVALQPGQDQVLIGGADGVPKIYRLFREKARKIGDDFNKIKDFPEMPGRIYDVAFTSDGSKAVVCSSLDGAGFIQVLDVGEGKKLVDLEGPLQAIYSVSISPDNKRVASVGFSGDVLLHDLETGKKLQTFPAVPISPQTAAAH
ncbi:c-type cytochrome domain-containing protein [Bremerella cremea]|uniref:WD40 domain-containing protein n=1 Tax=Bremerella cremea TaxID=1031537 RepID=UPI0031EFD2DF